MNIDNQEPIVQLGPGPVSPPWINQGPGPVIPSPLPETGPGPVIPSPLPETGPGPVILPNQDMPDVKIKSLFSNTYIILGYNNILYAVSPTPQQGQDFKIIPINNYQLKLKVVSGQFVRTDYNGVLVADSNQNNATIFTIFRTGYLEFSLMTPEGKYVTVRQRDKMIVARDDFAGPRTRFKFRKVD